MHLPADCDNVVSLCPLTKVLGSLVKVFDEINQTACWLDVSVATAVAEWFDFKSDCCFITRGDL